jgi:hypothetical protein
VSTFYNGWRGLKVTAILEWGRKTTSKRAARKAQRAASAAATGSDPAAAAATVFQAPAKRLRVSGKAGASRRRSQRKK